MSPRAFTKPPSFQRSPHRHRNHTGDIYFTAVGEFSTYTTHTTITVTRLDWYGSLSPGHATVLRGEPVPGWDLAFGSTPSPITVTATPPGGLHPSTTRLWRHVYQRHYPGAITMNTDPDTTPGLYPIPFPLSMGGIWSTAWNVTLFPTSRWSPRSRISRFRWALRFPQPSPLILHAVLFLFY